MAFLDTTGLERLWQHIVSKINESLSNIPQATDSEILAMMIEEGAFPVVYTEDGAVLCSATNEILMI